jgi:hypothetical protein
MTSFGCCPNLTQLPGVQQSNTAILFLIFNALPKRIQNVSQIAPGRAAFWADSNGEYAP